MPISTVRRVRIRILRDKVDAGKLGMKTGEGMRKWTPEQADAVRARLSRFLAEQAKARKNDWHSANRARSRHCGESNCPRRRQASANTPGAASP